MTFFPRRMLILAALAFAISNIARAEETHDDSFAYKLLDNCLETAAREVDRDGARPTILSRAMAIWATSVFDAWAAYDERAIGSRLGDSLRRPAVERTLENKKKAIAYAGYRVLLDIYPEDSAFVTAAFAKLGYDPTDTSTDRTTPQGIGNVAAAEVIQFRHHDGANQCGDEVGSAAKPYADYTFYRPVNPPDQILDLNRWQPIAFDNPKGPGKIRPGFLTPHWYRVKPFALDRADQFRPPPPPAVDSEQMQRDLQECIDFNANLTPERKAIIEFMRDGPRSTGQSGHWLRFAQEVSRRDKNDLDRDVKLYFCVANTAFDAFIAAWDCKRVYDNSRPYWYIRTLFKDKEIKGWGGPGKGTVTMKGEQWIPYSPSIFITPPFPGYVSGHSTVSGACAKMLELFTGNDRFEISVERTPGELTDKGFEAPKVVLSLPTFSAAAKMAGISRVMGGYHVQADNIAGLELGRKVAEFSWKKYQKYFDGK